MGRYKIDNLKITAPEDIFKNNYQDYANNMIKNIKQAIDIEKSMEPVWERKEKVEQAQLDTAKHTEEMRDSLKVVIENQSKYIGLLEEQLKDISLTLDCIFNTLYDEKEILEESREIYKYIYSEISNGHKVNLREILVDKGMDVALQVITMIITGINRK
nr:hypothetical protein [uncultured Anaerocolumna sp.]